MWTYESLYPDYRQGLEGKLIYKKKTSYQDLRIYDTTRFGRVLMLDGIVQTTEKDEFIYHEMMSHPLLLLHPDPKNVLIIGGGDGGILREVLKHKNVKRAVLVEIDESVITLSKKYLKKICGNAFSDARTEVIVDDGARFVKTTKEKFDVIITDSTDPIGPAKVLFSRKYYDGILSCLSAKGMMICQSGSTFFQTEEIRSTWTTLNKVFPRAWMHCIAVPTYVGGFFGLMVGSKMLDLENADLAALEKKWGRIGIKTNYFNPYVHISSALLPEYVRRALA